MHNEFVESGMEGFPLSKRVGVGVGVKEAFMLHLTFF